MEAVPVYYEVGRGRANPKEKSIDHELDPMCEIEYSLKYDKKKCFLDELDRLERLTRDVPHDALHWMFHYDSGKCFAAVLKGETAGMFEFHERLPVLHKAADFEAAEITKLFLSGNESQANLRLDYYYRSKQNWKEVLPLHLILENIRTSASLPLLMPFDEKGSRSRCHSYLTINKMVSFQLEPEQLVFKLLFHMMTDLHMRKPLEIVRLLARQTKEIEQEFLMYLKEGKVVELITLLLVARETVMPSFVRKLEIRKFVVKEIASLNFFVLRSEYEICNDKMVQEAQEKKAKMKAILLILEIFDRIGDKLAAYLRIKQKNVSIVVRANDFAWFAEEAGFDVKLDLFFQGGVFFGNSTSNLGGYDYDSKETNNYEMDGHNNNETPRDSESNKSYDEAYVNAISDDEPVYHGRRNRPNPKEKSVMLEFPLVDIQYALKYDQQKNFVHLLDSIESITGDVLYLTLDWMFHYDSGKCFAAVLNGETAGIFEFTSDVVPCEGIGQLPILHKAAHFGAPKITKLFLPGNESLANLRCDVDHMKGVLPLNIVLEKIRTSFGMPLEEKSFGPCSYLDLTDKRANRVRVESKRHVFKLIFHITDLRLRNALENLRLLAQQTKEIEQEFFMYLKERKVVELVALLMVAREKVMPGFEGRLKIRNFVLKEIASLNVSIGFRSANEVYNEGQCKKSEMEAMLLVLEIFDRIGDILAAYLQIERKEVSREVEAKEVAWLLGKAGFNVKHDLFYERDDVFFGHTTSNLGGYDFDTGETNNYEMDGHNNNEASRDCENNNSHDKVYNKAYNKAVTDGEVLDKVNKPLEDLILNDDKDGFVSFIRSQLKEENSGTGENILQCGEIIRWICTHHAKNCATALLKGETGLTVDLNVPLKSGFYPLHHAAENLSPCLTDLFLCHEARTDVHCSINGGMLPLNVALEAIHGHECFSDWHPTKSIFKLFCILFIPELIGPLETIKLLAERTEDLQLICSFIVREGRLVELAALLFVAWKKLLVPVNGAGVDSSVIRQCITGELISLIDQEYKLMNTGRCKELRQCRKMKDVMLSASVMLKVFQRFGHDIDSYHQEIDYRRGMANYSLVDYWSYFFNDRGFALKGKDIEVGDMKCFINRIGPKHSEELNSSIEHILHSNASLLGKAQSASSVKRRKKRVLNDLPPIGQVCSIPSRLFHTCRLPMSRSVPDLYKPVGTDPMNTRKHHICQLPMSRSAPKLYKPVGAPQMNAKQFSAMRAFCYLAIKRRIR